MRKKTIIVYVGYEGLDQPADLPSLNRASVFRLPSSFTL